MMGEFGRTPMVETNPGLGRSLGRDHHPQAYTIWMAGGGVKAGVTVGQTDDLGYTIVDDPVHVNDFHATLLHLLGLNHEKLTYKFQGRHYRLTDIHGKVVKGLEVVDAIGKVPTWRGDRPVDDVVIESVTITEAD